MMTYENLARVMNAEKYEGLNRYKCTKSVCIRTDKARGD